MQKNIFNEDIEECCTNPITGFYRDGFCNTDKLDGAFQDLNYDPQNVEIIGSNITRLPEKYKNNKLGHNWSISWVADNFKKEIKR